MSSNCDTSVPQNKNFPYSPTLMLYDTDKTSPAASVIGIEKLDAVRFAKYG